MKKSYPHLAKYAMLLALFYFTPFLIFGQDQFQKYLFSSKVNSAIVAERNENWDYIIGGQYWWDYSQKSQDLYILKLDSCFNPLWSHTYGGDDWESLPNRGKGKGIIAASDGSLIVSSRTMSFGAKGSALLFSLNNQGSVLWSKIFDSGENEDLTGTIEDGSGYILYGGSTAFQNDFAGLIIRVNKNGELIWNKHYRINSESNLFLQIQRIDNDKLAVGGGGSGGSLHMVVNSNGDPEWERYLANGTNGNSLASLKVMDSSAIYFSGTLSDTLNKKTIVTPYVIKYDILGNPLWLKAYSFGSDVSFPFGVEESGDGNLLMTGQMYVDSLNGYQALIMKIDSSGNILLAKSYTWGENGFLQSIIETSDNGTRV